MIKTPAVRQKNIMSIIKIKRLQEIATNKTEQERDYWKDRAIKAEARADSYQKQARIYAEEKLKTELINIRASEIIRSAQIKLTEMKTVRPEHGYIKAEEAADVLAAINKLDMYG